MSYHHSFAFGRATADAKIVQSKTSKTFATFSIAVNSYLGEERGQETTYYECLVFGKNQCEVAAENIKKGDLVVAHGTPSVEPYLSKKAEPKASFKLIVNNFYMFKEMPKPKSKNTKKED